MSPRASLAILLVVGATAANAQEIENRQVVVQAEAGELPSAYGAPPDLSHGRISTLTKSYVLSPLSSHDFPHLIEWAMNIFVDREFSGRQSTSGGFAQSVEIPVLLPEEKLEVGLEMQYRSGGEALGLNGTTKGLAIGPTLAWRPTKNARFDLSPLIGTSDHTPAVEVFAVFSFSSGGPTAGEVENPASARSH